MSPIILALLIVATTVVFLALLATHDQHDDIDPDELPKQLNAGN